MATYNHTMQLSTGGTLSYSTGPTDANAQRIIDAHRTLFGMSPSATASQVWTKIGETVFDWLKTRTINQERDAAAASAVSGVNPIP